MMTLIGLGLSSQVSSKRREKLIQRRSLTSQKTSIVDYAGVNKFQTRKTVQAEIMTLRNFIWKSNEGKSASTSLPINM